MTALFEQLFDCEETLFIFVTYYALYAVYDFGFWTAFSYAA
jgi:hypothetical protein